MLNYLLKTALNKTLFSTFAIEYNGEYVGNIGLMFGQDVYRKLAEIGYFIGEQYWDKGIATKAVKILTNYGFNKLNIVRIQTGVFEYNIIYDCIRKMRISKGLCI